MSDIIQLSSGDEENKENPAKGKIKCKAVNENETTVQKEKPATGTLKRKRSNVNGSGEIGVKGENWTIFQEFLNNCHNTEVKKRKGDAKLMTAILDKLSHRFHDADPEYTQSEGFRESIKSAQNLVENDPSNLFVHMKQVGDELKLRCVTSRDNKKRKPRGKEDIPPEKQSTNSANDVTEDEEEHLGKEVNRRHCKKLELIFEKVYLKVKKLEEKEVDWDEEEDSAYMRLERYKKRLYTIWEKWQEVRGRLEEVKKLKYRKIAFSGSRYPELDHAIEKYVNKTKCFPDFMDIYKLTSNTLRKEMEEDVSDDQVKSIASAAFQILGNQLQKVRLYDFWNCCMSYLPSASDVAESMSDPADQNEALALALKENKQNYRQKLSDVINSFVDKQDKEKHEPVEVILGTDDEGSAPSGDEEEEEEEEENPEDIICISSSSSEDGDGETKSNFKQQNKRDEHSSEESPFEPENTMKSGVKSDSERPADYIGFSDKVKELPHMCSEKMKIEKGEESRKMEPIASCSSAQRKPKASTSKFCSRKKETKAGGNLDIVTLSESDSEES